MVVIGVGGLSGRLLGVSFQTGTSSYGVSLWKFIRCGWDSFSRVTRFYIGDATKVRFWNDIWCGLVLLV